MKPPREFSVLVLEIGSEATDALARSGFSVARASTGEEAMQSVRQQPFDLVLLDMSVPGWNGLEACREIREFAPDTKIIMIAAPDADEDRARSIEAGADDCVNHPLHLRELVARARAVLRLSSPKATGQPAEGQPELPKVDAPAQSTSIESPRSMAGKPMSAPISEGAHSPADASGRR